ncbi:uncharacterized protein K452DRAFT_286993 [Aplosporella prunicola CBS 121167]|uniref:Uncharacterized protein n=1 Tax=Aplosporella prunicola CBS 121167 TaxID=1176127 RepID=A0A6A6BEI4_9PEZI|nr:uncharacterized protein K452DRAFT_286993 [Aplosporella prunicola CBS 121167]KAF2142569.1 hypothetical protein K452DRAFT_286993 [Aplosporella prunicola CBS 121167]
MDVSGMSALSLGIEEMELDERDEYAYENRSGEGQHQPAPYMSPIPEPLKLSKEKLSSPISAQRTSTHDSMILPPPVTPPPRAQRNSTLRIPSGRMERDSLGNIVHYLSAGETPTIEELNYAIAIHKSGTMSQSRRSQHARSGSTPHLPPPTPTRLSQASTVRASRLSPSRLSRLSSAVRQQLAAQAAGTSVINRGHPRASARFSSNGGGSGGGSGNNASAAKPPSRTPLATISSSNVNLQNAGLGSAATTGAKLVGAPKGKRPISVERTGRWSSLRGVKEGMPAQNEGSQSVLGTSPVRGNEAFL